MAKPQKSTAQSEVPGLVKKGPLYYLKRDWQLYALMLLPMVFIIVFKYFAYTGLSVAFLDYKIGKGYAGSKFVGLKIFEKVFKHRDFTKAVVNTLLLNVLDAGTIQCAAQNDLIPPEWVADGSLYPNQTVTAADFLAVLIPGAAGRRPLADAVPVPDSVPVYARRAVGQAVAEGLIAPEALTKPLNRSSAAEICRRLHI